MTSREYIAYWVSRYGFVLLICGFLLLVISALAFLPRVQAPGEMPAGPASAENEAALPSAPATLTNPAILNVASDIDGSTVMVDFDSVGITPLYDYKIEPGVKIISMKSGSIQRDTVIVLASNESRWIYLAGTNVASTFNPNASPPSARPVLPQQQTPATTPQRRPTQQPIERSTDVTPPPPVRQPEQPVADDPPPQQVQFGSLLVDSTPSQADVRLDGLLVGTTPLSLVNVAIGTSNIVISKEGYESYTEQVVVAPNQRSTVAGVLSKIDNTGTVTILVQPWGSIYIDGQLQKRDTDQMFTTSLEAGTYLVTGVHPKLGTRAQRITVEPGQTNSVILQF